MAEPKGYMPHIPWGEVFISPQAPQFHVWDIYTRQNQHMRLYSLSLSIYLSFFFPLDILPNNVRCCIVGISTLSAGPRTISLVLIGKCVTENWKKIFKVLRRRRREKKKEKTISLERRVARERGTVVARYAPHRPAPFAPSDIACRPSATVHYLFSPHHAFSLEG